MCTVLLVAVTACGTDQSEEADPTSASAVEDGSSASDAFPVIIEHRHGSTEIAAEPQRVVTVGFTDHDPVLALGVVPVGATVWITETELPEWSAAALAEAGGEEPTLLPVAEIDFEAVASLEPDLILALHSGITPDQYELLTQIAPTVAQPADHPDFGAPWEKQTRMIGEALGLADEAETVIAEAEDRFAAARESAPELEGAQAIAAYDFGADSLGLYAAEDPRGRMLTSLGAEIPEDIDALAGDEFFATISVEQLDLLDGADLVLWCGQTDPYVTEQPVYQGLDLAAEGRDVYVDCTTPVGVAMSYSTVLSLPFAVDELVPLLVDAVDGDPST